MRRRHLIIRHGYCAKVNTTVNLPFSETLKYIDTHTPNETLSRKILSNLESIIFKALQAFATNSFFFYASVVIKMDNAAWSQDVLCMSKALPATSNVRILALWQQVGFRCICTEDWFLSPTVLIQSSFTRETQSQGGQTCYLVLPGSQCPLIWNQLQIGSQGNGANHKIKTERGRAFPPPVSDCACPKYLWYLVSYQYDYKCTSDLWQVVIPTLHLKI